MVGKFLLIILVLLISGCRGTDVGISAPVEEAMLPDFAAELWQVSDYPFYELHYQGGYGFAEYLDTGIYPSQVENVSYRPAFACSGFAAFGDPDVPIFGRNFDWHEHPALILFTKPPDGYASVSMVDISYLGYDSEHTPLDDPEGLRDAPYLPFDGMNEHGLAVGMMAVGHSDGGTDPEKRTLDSLEVIRLLLDYTREVDESLALMSEYNVDFGTVPIHYFLADQSGNAAVVEYLDGEPIVVRTDGSWQVSTNFLLTEEQPRGADSSCWRYNHLARSLAEASGNMNENNSMSLLQEVSQKNTRWSLVYNLKDLTISAAINSDFDQTYEFTLVE